MQAPHGDLSDRTIATRRRQLLGAVVLVLVLLLQAAWSFSTRPEPFPSVRLPAFGSAATADGVFPKSTVELAITYAEGEDTAVDVRELMTGFAGNSARPSLEWAVTTDDGTTTAAQDQALAWIAGRARTLADDGREPVGLVIRSCAVDIHIRTATTEETGCESDEIEL